MQVNRSLYLNRLIDRMNNGLVKVVTGVRRCGKTYLLFNLFREYLRKELRVPDEHVIEVALDTDGDSRFRDPNQLGEYLTSRISDKTAQYYVLLDEVQFAISNTELRGDEPPRLYGVLNGLLRKGNVDVYVTGSNSKMLSSDIMTQFRGRGDEVRVRPLSFSEFMQGFDGDIYRGWAEYTVFGGMPLVLSMRTDEQKSRYLENLFAETYLKDIIDRNRVSKTQELDDLVNVLASSIGSLTSPSKIEATFKSVLRSKLSSNTITTYINYLEESFLIEEAQRYDIKGRKYIGSPKKYYFEDMGLRNARLGFRQIEETHIMENIVYNELRSRGFSVDVGNIEKRMRVDGSVVRKELEIDFVANMGSKRYYLQSALHIPDSKKEKQEKESMNEVGDSFKKIVLVRDVVKPTHDISGILTMSVYDFLLNGNSLEY